MTKSTQPEKQQELRSLDALTVDLKGPDTKKIAKGQFAILDINDQNSGIGYKITNDGKYEFGRWDNLNDDPAKFTKAEPEEEKQLESLVRANIQGRSAYAWLFKKDIPGVVNDSNNEFIALSKTNNQYHLSQSGEFVKLLNPNQDKISYDDQRYPYLINSLNSLTSDAEQKKTFEQLLEEATPRQAAPAQETDQDKADSEFVKDITLRAYNLTASDIIKSTQKEERKKYLQDLAAIQDKDVKFTEELKKLEAKKQNDSLLDIFCNISAAISADQNQTDKQKITQDLAHKFAKFSDTLSDDNLVAYGQIIGFLHGKDDKNPPQNLDDSLNIRKGESAKAQSAFDAQKDALETSFKTAFEARMNQLNAPKKAVQESENKDPTAPDLEEKKQGFSDAEKEKVGVLRKGVVMAGQIAVVAALGVSASPLVAALAAGALLWWYSKQSATQKDLEAQKELDKLRKEEAAFKKNLESGENYEMAEDVKKGLEAQEAQAAQGKAPRVPKKKLEQQPEEGEPQPPAQPVPQDPPAPAPAPNPVPAPHQSEQGAAVNPAGESNHVAEANASSVKDAENTIKQAHEHIEIAQNNIDLISQMEAGTRDAPILTQSLNAAVPAAPMLQEQPLQPHQESTVTAALPVGQNANPVYDTASPAVTLQEMPMYDRASPRPTVEQQEPASDSPKQSGPVVVVQSEGLYNNANTEGEITEQQPDYDSAPQHQGSQPENSDKNMSSSDRQAIQNELAIVKNAIDAGNAQPAAQPSTKGSRRLQKPTRIATGVHTDGEGNIGGHSH